VTATFHDLWCRRQRAARASKFARAHALCGFCNPANEIEWLNRPLRGPLDPPWLRMAQKAWKREQAKNKRLHALKF